MEIKKHGTDIANPKTIISSAAGVPMKKIKEWSNYKYNVIRFMPNIPISLSSGSIAWYTDDYIASTKNIINDIFQGPSNVWVGEEKLIDYTTALSGCGPAYIAKMYEIYKKIGIDLGLNEYEINNLLQGMFLGTGKMLIKHSGKDIIEEVCSEGGATEKALNVLDKENFDDIIKKSIYSSLDRIEKISRNLD